MLGRKKITTSNVSKTFCYRQKLWLDVFSDEYYENYRTPLQAIYVEWIQAIEKSDVSLESKNALAVQFFNAESQVALTSEDKALDQICAETNRKVSRFQESVWAAIINITAFYRQAVAGNVPLNEWQQMLEETLFCDFNSNISAHLSREMVNALVRIIQDFTEIDSDLPRFLQEDMVSWNNAGHSTQEKIQNFLHFFENLSKGKLRSLELKAQREIEEEHVLFYFRHLLGGREDDTPDEYKAFKQYCHEILYARAITKTFRQIFPDLDEATLTRLDEILRRDLIHETLLKIETTKKSADIRMKRLQGYIIYFGSFAGCEKPFENHQGKKYYTRFVVSQAIQKRRSRQIIVTMLAEVLSMGLALEEGCVAGKGAAEFFLRFFQPAIAYIIGISTTLSGYNSNKKIVQEDTERLLAAMLDWWDGNTALMTTKQRVTMSVVGVAALMSSGVLAYFGFLAGVEMTGFFFALAGLAAIPVFGWVIGSIAAFCGLLTIIALLGSALYNRFNADFQKEATAFWVRNFFSPTQAGGTRVNQLFSMFRIVLSVLIIAAICAASILLFYAPLLALFGGGLVGSILAYIFVAINGFVWIQLNFTKAMIFLDGLDARGVGKCLGYFVLTVLTLPVLAVTIPLQCISALFAIFQCHAIAKWMIKVVENIHRFFNPACFNTFLNKLPSRSLSGIDLFNKQDDRPEILAGINRLMFNLVKLPFYVPEVALRLSLVLLYKALWLPRVFFRLGWNAILPQYYCREANANSLLVPRYTNYVRDKIFMSHTVGSAIDFAHSMNVGRDSADAVNNGLVGQGLLFGEKSSSVKTALDTVFCGKLPDSSQVAYGVVGGSQGLTSTALASIQMNADNAKKRYPRYGLFDDRRIVAHDAITVSPSPEVRLAA